MNSPNITKKPMLEKQITHPINHIAEGEGPTVIFVHGASGSIYNWDKNIPAISQAGYSTFAIDLLGHGDSHKPEELEAYHIEEVYAHLESWIEEHNIAKPIIFVGHSMGAHLIMVYALRNPGSVRKLVVVDPLYTPDQGRRWVKLLGKHHEMSIKMMQAAPKNMFNPFRRWKRNVSKTLTALKIRMVAADIDRMHPNILYTTSSVWDLRPQLSALNIETLVLWGKKDRTLLPESFPQLVEKLPKAESLEFPNCGHTPHIDEPERFNERVIEFLSK